MKKKACVTVLWVLSLVLTACSATHAKREIYSRAQGEMPDPNEFFYIRWLSRLSLYPDIYSGTASAMPVSRQMQLPSVPAAPPVVVTPGEPEPQETRFQLFAPRNIRFAPQPSYSFSLIQVRGFPGLVEASSLYFWDVPEPRFWTKGYGFVGWTSLDGQKMGGYPVSWWGKVGKTDQDTMTLVNPEVPEITLDYRKPRRHNVLLPPLLLDLKKVYGEQADPPFIAYDPNTGIIRRVSPDGKMSHIGKLKGWKKPVRSQIYWSDALASGSPGGKSWVWNPPGGGFLLGPMKRGDPPYHLVYAEESGTFGLLNSDSRLLFRRSVNMRIERIEMAYDAEKGEGYIVLIMGRGQTRAVVFDRFGKQVARLRFPAASPGNPIAISDVHPIYHAGKRFWFARAGETFILIWDDDGRLVQWLDPEGAPGSPGRVKPGEYLIPVATRAGVTVLLDATGLVVGSFPPLHSHESPSFSPLDIDGDGIHEWVYQKGNAVFIYGGEDPPAQVPPAAVLRGFLEGAPIAPLRGTFQNSIRHLNLVPTDRNSVLVCPENFSEPPESVCTYIPDARSGDSPQHAITFPGTSIRPTFDFSGDRLQDFISTRLDPDDKELTVTISEIDGTVIYSKVFSGPRPSRRVSAYEYGGSLFLSVPHEGRLWSDPSQASILLNKGSGSGEPPPFNVLNEVAVMRGGRIFKAFRTSFTQAVLKEYPETTVPFAGYGVSGEEAAGGSAGLSLSEGKAYLIDSFGKAILGLASEGYNIWLGFGRVTDLRRCFREALPTLQNPAYIAFVCRVTVVPRDRSPVGLESVQPVAQAENLSLLVLVGNGKIRAGIYRTESALSGVALVNHTGEGVPQIIGLATDAREGTIHAALVRLPVPPVVYSEP